VSRRLPAQTQGHGAAEVRTRNRDGGGARRPLDDRERSRRIERVVPLLAPGAAAVLAAPSPWPTCTRIMLWPQPRLQKVTHYSR